MCLVTDDDQIVWCDLRPEALDPCGITLAALPDAHDSPQRWRFSAPRRVVEIEHGANLELRDTPSAPWGELRVVAPSPPRPLSHAPLLHAPADHDPIRGAYCDARGRWVVSLDRGLDLDCARALVGLGPGLTPSGDDLLGGYGMVLAACQALPAALADALRDEARTATHALSRARLHRHLRAEGTRAECQLVTALLHGDARGFDTHLATLGRLGHHSGADFVDGALLAARTFSRCA